MLDFGTIKGGQRQHHRLLRHMFGAPQLFFDTVPKGRILSRFSGDMNTVDEKLPDSLRQFVGSIFRVGFTYFVVINSLNPRCQCKYCRMRHCVFFLYSSTSNVHLCSISMGKSMGLLFYPNHRSIYKNAPV